MKLIFCFLFSVSLLFGQKPDFCKEDITFKFDGSYFEVEGFYWFANNNIVSLRSEVFYPFPNGTIEKIDSIRVINVSTVKKIKYHVENEQGISFKIFIEPHDTLLLQICYRQKINSDSAVYILKTTRTWNKPLSLAEYKLIVPNSMKVKKFSYEPDKFYNIASSRIYYWKKENFMPVRDMVFSFH